MFLALLAFYPKLLFQNQSFLFGFNKVFSLSLSFRVGGSRKGRNFEAKTLDRNIAIAFSFGISKQQNEKKHILVLKSMLIRMKYLFWFQYCFGNNATFHLITFEMFVYDVKRSYFLKSFVCIERKRELSAFHNLSFPFFFFFLILVWSKLITFCCLPDMFPYRLNSPFCKTRIREHSKLKKRRDTSCFSRYLYLMQVPLVLRMKITLISTWVKSQEISVFWQLKQNDEQEVKLGNKNVSHLKTTYKSHLRHPAYVLKTISINHDCSREWESVHVPSQQNRNSVSSSRKATCPKSTLIIHNTMVIDESACGHVSDKTSMATDNKLFFYFICECVFAFFPYIVVAKKSYSDRKVEILIISYSALWTEAFV